MEPSFCGQLFPFTGPQAKDLLSQTPDQTMATPRREELRSMLYVHGLNEIFLQQCDSRRLRVSSLLSFPCKGFKKLCSRFNQDHILAYVQLCLYSKRPAERCSKLFGAVVVFRWFFFFYGMYHVPNSKVLF